MKTELQIQNIDPMFPTIAEYNQVIQINNGSAFRTLSNLSFIPSRTAPVRIYSFGSGSYAVVFKAKEGNVEFAIRCFISADQENIIRYREIGDYLSTLNASWVAKTKLFEDEILVKGHYFPIVKMDWIEGKLINSYIGQVLNDNDALSNLQHKIVALSESLESNMVGHGDIQCGNIIITKNEKEIIIKLIDYDGMYIPAFANKINIKRGREEFQHPDYLNIPYNEKMDRFSFWIIICALEALKFDKSLWLEVMQSGFNTLDNLLFTGNDFKNFDNSKLIIRLHGLNQPSLSFYLNKLKEFCISSPLNTETPIIFDHSRIEIYNTPPKEHNRKNNSYVQIITDPPGLAVLSSLFQKIGISPLSLNRSDYINQVIIISNGIEYRQAKIEDSDVINIKFQNNVTIPLILDNPSHKMSVSSSVPPDEKELTNLNGGNDSLKMMIAMTVIIIGAFWIVLIWYHSGEDKSTSHITYDKPPISVTSGHQNNTNLATDHNSDTPIIDTSTAVVNENDLRALLSDTTNNNSINQDIDTTKKNSDSIALANSGGQNSLSNLQGTLTKFDSMVRNNNYIKIDYARDGAPIYDSPDPATSHTVGYVSKGKVINVGSEIVNGYYKVVSGNITGYLSEVNIYP